MSDPRPPQDTRPVVIDAGVKNYDHYKQRLPSWRLAARDNLIPLIRSETPYLAALQTYCRTPALDAYFAFTANLGTHTFFMTILPILFWGGQTTIARDLTHVLASGVFWSGFMKDTLCLPRPLSPPLQRISRSHSAALEYGFPSTHSTNSVSVAVYILLVLSDPIALSLSPTTLLLARAASTFYAASIVIGRLYCGMHGFADVVVGSLLGALLGWSQHHFGPAFNAYILNSTTYDILAVTALVLGCVWLHPEPADNCPCFDDSVAFSGVVIGLELGSRHFATSGYAAPFPVRDTVPYSFAALGILATLARILLGVVVIFAWRSAMKPLLLAALPPVFRVIEHLGLALPRRFFLNASQYTTIPPPHPGHPGAQSDNLIPPARDALASLTALARHPRRRTVSIGPQSEADAYEAIANRAEQRRRRSSVVGTSPRRDTLHVPGSSPGSGSGSALDDGDPDGEREAQEEREAKEERESDARMLRGVQRPRVRYDVEVVTKLIVYCGIGWLSVEGVPVVFELVGLGLGVRPGSTVLSS